LQRVEQMRKANVTHVLSVLRYNKESPLFANYKHFLVDIDDVEDEDLLQHFAATNAFIEEGLAGGGGVFVHCAMGKSRSATCCIAYMMHKYHVSPQEALDHIRKVRPIVEPNEGFWQQLEMYHRMNMPLKVEESPIYQRWIYQREVQLSSECGMAPEASKIRYEDEHLPNEDAESAEFDVKCKKCRRTVATSAFIIPHKPPPHNEPFPTELTCAHHFIDPLSWMRDELGKGEIEGRFDCPKCKAQIGKYSWKGMRCSCGKWETPAITLAKGKCDEVRKLNAGSAGVRRGPGVGAPATRAGGRGLL